jgi:kynurenine formamidase
MPDQFRAELDFDISFTNGGSLHGEGFRIDIGADTASDAELGAALVRDLGLLMAGDVQIRRRRIFRERHKRVGQGGGPAAAPGCPTLRRADLSHVIEEGMVTVPGLPAPQIWPRSVSSQLPRYAPGVTFAIGEVMMCGNTGTYLDSPAHRFPDGVDLAALPLDRLADLEAIVVDVAGASVQAIGAGHFVPYEVGDKAVLIRTGWDAHWGTDEYHSGHPFLTEAAVRYLADSGAVLVGIDAANVDDTGDPERPAHSVLLAAGIPVCEHLTGLDALPGSGFRFTAVPARISGFGTFPVRAYATWYA